MIVWVVVFLLVAIPTAWSLISYATQPADQRVPAAGGEVTIGEPGDYAVYAESTRGSPGYLGGVEAVTAPSGAAVAVRPQGFSENITQGSRVAERIGTFTATETGTYRIVGDDRGTAAGDQLVVSTRTAGSLLAVVGGAIVTGLLLIAGLVGGLVLLVAGRRRPPPGPFGAPHPPGPYNPYGPHNPYGPPGPYAGQPGAPYPGGPHPGTPPGAAPWGPPTPPPPDHRA